MLDVLRPNGIIWPPNCPNLTILAPKRPYLVLKLPKSGLPSAQMTPNGSSGPPYTALSLTLGLANYLFIFFNFFLNLNFRDHLKRLPSRVCFHWSSMASSGKSAVPWLPENPIGDDGADELDKAEGPRRPLHAALQKQGTVTTSEPNHTCHPAYNLEPEPASTRVCEPL